MDKYGGMNRVNAVAAPREVKCKKSKKRKPSETLRRFLFHCLTVLVIALILFGCKFLPDSRLSAVPETVREAVCFDFSEFVEDLFGEAE